MDGDLIPPAPEALPEDWLARIKPELNPGERLIWAGQSRPGRSFSGRSLAILYTLGFAVISVVGFACLFGTTTRPSTENAFALMGVCGGIISFLIAIGVVANVLDKRSERRLLVGNLYALTDARAIVWSPSGGGVAVHSIRKGAIKSVHRVEYADGSGSVHFDNASSSIGTANGGFREIPDARRVEALVRLHLIGDDRTPSA